MTKIVYDLLLALEQCDDTHNRCDYLMEHNEITYLLEYITNLRQENQQLKEDISFCLHSIKQEMEMSTDSRTRNEMTSCYEILKRWNK